LGPDALNGLQQAEPFALDVTLETEQLDLVFTDIGLDGKGGGLPTRGQRLQGARRAVHLVTDPADVEDDKVLAVGIDQSLQLADHMPTTVSRSAAFLR